MSVGCGASCRWPRGFLSAARATTLGISWQSIRSGPVAPSINDALNIAAAGTFLVVLGIASGLARYPKMTRMRLYSDAVAVTSLSLMVLCRFWSSGVVGSLSWHQTELCALYTFFGVAVLGTLLWVGSGFDESAGDRRRYAGGRRIRRDIRGGNHLGAACAAARHGLGFRCRNDRSPDQHPVLGRLLSHGDRRRHAHLGSTPAVEVGDVSSARP